MFLSVCLFFCLSASASASAPPLPWPLCLSGFFETRYFSVSQIFLCIPDWGAERINTDIQKEKKIFQENSDSKWFDAGENTQRHITSDMARRPTDPKYVTHNKGTNEPERLKHSFCVCVSFLYLKAQPQMYMTNTPHTHTLTQNESLLACFLLVLCVKHTNPSHWGERELGQVIDKLYLAFIGRTLKPKLKRKRY